MTDLARARVLISGRVQGVFYRAHTRDQARARGLKGWVRNLPDGRVAALFEGKRAAIEDMINWCRLGPPYAAVDEVQVEWQPYQGEFEDFRIVY
jgi:acylphosphatase|uniref:acylphosphatase n=1 Tax=Desulfobacca acetoxidans TaxID=60893 RepID=A0A7C3SHZ0_9BACT